MADGAPEKKPEAPKEVTESKAADGKEKKPGKKFDILSTAIVVLVAVNLGAVVFMGGSVKKLTSRVSDLQTQVTNMEKPEASKEEDGETPKNLGKELTPPTQGTLYPMESFLVNISSDQGPKFLQTQMELELNEPSLEDEITRKKAAIRDAVIVLLSSRSYQELRQADGIKRLRIDILRSINNLLTTGKVREIYFTQFHFN